MILWLVQSVYMSSFMVGTVSSYSVGMVNIGYSSLCPKQWL